MAEPFMEHSYSCMVENVSDYAIFLLDCSGVVQTWNPAAVLMKGYHKEEIIGRNYNLLYPEEARRKGHPEHNLHMAAENGTFQEEAWRQRKDSSLFWAMVEIIAITDAAGKVTGFCKLTRDISERQGMEAALHDADRRKDEFLAMLAHELRNPLAPISAAAALLSLDKIDALSAKKASQVIIRQVKHMTELVDDLLDVSRVSRGQITLNMASLDMKAIVASAVEQVRPLIENREHTLAIKLAPSRAHVKGDEKRLIQILSNLLNNAAKYTPPRGTISIELSATETDVRVEVTDNGIGIDHDAQQVIFELFEQVKRTSARTMGGLGIGLSLVRRLANLHGGKVLCHSDGIGFGSRFTVNLPQLAQDQEVPERRLVKCLAELPVAEARLSVLVVDDNVDAAEMLEFFLASAGYHVKLAHTAKAALEVAKETYPNVCILDIGLPDGSGHDLAVDIRSLTSPPSILIALTGYGMTRDRDQATESGFDHYFVKPVDLDALSEVLAGVVTQPGWTET